MLALNCIIFTHNFKRVEPLQLQNATNWSQLWATSVAAEPMPDRPGFTLEIPPITVPFLLENHIIAVAASSSTAPDSWKVAGKVAKKISTGITFGGALDATISDSRRLYLRQINLFRFTPYTPTYGLVITPAYYLTQINLAVWIYTGIDTDTVTEQLNQIESAIEELNV